MDISVPVLFTNGYENQYPYPHLFALVLIPIIHLGTDTSTTHGSRTHINTRTTYNGKIIISAKG